jgi:hypothetical protein
MSRKFISTMVASLVLAVGGTVLAGDTTLVVTPTSVNEDTGVFTADIAGGASGDFQVTGETEFLPGHFPNGLPPGPCRGVAQEWNSRSARGNLNLRSALSLIARNVQYRCNVDIQISVEGGASGATPVASMRPAP